MLICTNKSRLLVAAVIIAVGCGCAHESQKASQPPTAAVDPDDGVLGVFSKQEAERGSLGSAVIRNTSANRLLISEMIAYYQMQMLVAKDNIDNAETVVDSNGTFVPYRRKVVIWDPSLHAKVGYASDGFRTRYDPSHVGSDKDGYCLLPNIDVADERLRLLRATKNSEYAARILEALISAPFPGALECRADGEFVAL
jgi:flagellar basal body rod protein FlgC